MGFAVTVPIARPDAITLDTVQHQLDHLASARSLDGLSDADQRRYLELCRAERALLKTW